RQLWRRCAASPVATETSWCRCGRRSARTARSARSATSSAPSSARTTRSAPEPPAPPLPDGDCHVTVTRGASRHALVWRVLHEVRELPFRVGYIVREESKRPPHVEEARRPHVPHHSCKAAPLPSSRRQNESRADRIEREVSEDLQQVLVVLDVLRVKPFLEEAATKAVLLVEPPRIDAVHVSHPGGVLSRLRLDEEVVVRRHQAVRADEESLWRRGLFDQAAKRRSVAPGEEDPLLAVAPRGQVVEAGLERAAGGSWHEPNVCG